MFDEDSSLFDDEPEGSAVPAAGELPPPRLNPECLGHERIEQEILTAFNEGRLPHALIFSGLEGVGKATFSFRLARFLLSQSSTPLGGEGGGLFGADLPLTQPSPRRGEGFDVPPEDTVFKQVASGGHSDLLTIERLFDEKKGKLQDIVAVDEVRRMEPFLRMTASKDGGWRVVIVDDADTMNKSSQNAILKILEEPPANVLLILIAHRAGSLLPTIRSRCRTVAFPPLTLPVFSTLLRRQNPELADKDIATLYAITGGSAGQGLRLDREGGLETVANISAQLKNWPRWDWPAIHALSDKLARAENEEAYRTFQDLFLWMAELTARTGSGMPEALARHYNTESWLTICETLKERFTMARQANLDKKQAVMEAFMVFKT